jgi:glutamate---cysteine ligase / carboxylate-amine ligase
MSDTGELSPAVLHRRFDSAPRYRVGIEDEVMVLDPATFALVPRAQEVLDLLDGDRRFKLELPASQLELVTPPCSSVREAVTFLSDARGALVDATGGAFAFAGAGIHPFSRGAGELNRGRRYERIAREYGCVAQRQLTCALQVHVSVGKADNALAVYNAARSYLPLIAALAANAPFYEGVDTGLASVRPKLAELLPRQGVPPIIGSWQEFCGMLNAVAGGDPAVWWWELRPHAVYGTLEFRVPDGQTTADSAGMIAAVIQSLVAWLAARHEAGERLGTDPSWQIAENRWSACRHGIEGTIKDPLTGAPTETRDALQALLETLMPSAAELGCTKELTAAHGLLQENGAMAQRRIGDPHGVARWLSERFRGDAGG